MAAPQGQLLCQVEHAGLGQTHGVVAWVGLQGRPACFARQAVVQLQRQVMGVARQGFGKRVDQQLGRVEAVAQRWLVRAVSAQAVQLPGLQTGHKAVPHAVVVGG